MDDTLTYLDHAATTPLAPEVRAAMLPCLEEGFGNPSSRHRVGTAARAAVDAARRQVARGLGASEERVVFTSGGTEANNLAVLGAARAARAQGHHVLIGPGEHSSVRDSALALLDEGFDVEVATLGRDGSFDAAEFVGLVRDDTVVVALMAASNEHGAVYPVREVAAALARSSRRPHVHVDAVQAFGKLEVDLEELGVDSIAISAHKVHGPKGTGALVLSPRARLTPLVFGGGQEGAVRSGTENVAGIVGFGEAVRLADDEQPRTAELLASLKSRLERGLAEVDGVRMLHPGGGGAVLPSIAALIVPGPPAEVWLHHLEERGIMVSVGSACQSNKRDASPALLALGLSRDESRQVLRVSFSRLSTTECVDRLLGALSELTRELASLA